MPVPRAFRPRSSINAAIVLGLLLVLAGCIGLTGRTAPVVLYDFGPAPLVAAAHPPTAGSTPHAPLPTLILADPDTSAARLEGTALHYRLAYADASQVRAYAQSRWAEPPLQLLRQRLREAFAPSRTVLGPLEAARLTREGRSSDLLRVSLDEFSHYFETPQLSYGLVRLRATLVRGSAAGERVLGQRVFAVRVPASASDAAAAAKALRQASDQAVQQVVDWVNEPR